MSTPLIATIIGFGLAAGVLIGCIGVGGVILVPLLHYFAGIDIHVAIGAAMLAYLVSGAIGTIVFGNKKSIEWGMAPWLWAGAMPGALAGAIASGVAPAPLLELAIGSLTVASGAHALLGRQRAAAGSPGSEEIAGSRLGNATLAGLGLVTGFASALTGTGGPLVLIPLLMWLSQPVLVAIGLAQAIQLPIALLASAGNHAAGTLDYRLGALIGLGLAAGSWLGADLAHRLPRAMLHRFVALVLIAVGLFIVLRLMARQFGLG